MQERLESEVFAQGQELAESHKETQILKRRQKDLQRRLESEVGQTRTFKEHTRIPAPKTDPMKNSVRSTKMIGCFGSNVKLNSVPKSSDGRCKIAAIRAAREVPRLPISGPPARQVPYHRLSQASNTTMQKEYEGLMNISQQTGNSHPFWNEDSSVATTPRHGPRIS